MIVGVHLCWKMKPLRPHQASKQPSPYMRPCPVRDHGLLWAGTPVHIDDPFAAPAAATTGQACAPPVQYVIGSVNAICGPRNVAANQARSVATELLGRPDHGETVLGLTPSGMVLSADDVAPPGSRTVVLADLLAHVLGVPNRRSIRNRSCDHGDPIAERIRVWALFLPPSLRQQALASHRRCGSGAYRRPMRRRTRW